MVVVVGTVAVVVLAVVVVVVVDVVVDGCCLPLYLTDLIPLPSTQLVILST